MACPSTDSVTAAIVRALVYVSLASRVRVPVQLGQQAAVDAGPFSVTAIVPRPTIVAAIAAALTARVSMVPDPAMAVASFPREPFVVLWRIKCAGG